MIKHESGARDRARGALLGLAVGDALGTSVEFMPRGSFEPVTDLRGGGPFALPVGAWTDDTSMALCLGTSLVSRSGCDAHDQMKRYVSWYEQGYMSSTGVCFDIGGTTRAALHRFKETGDPVSGATAANTAGNGCLMRLAPVPIAALGADRETLLRWAATSSRTTHGAVECVAASELMASALDRALRGCGSEEVLTWSARDYHTALTPRLAEVVAGTWRHKTRDQIRGSGYVVECLEAALWCFAQTSRYEDAVLLAVNLGDDADTTGAVCGQLAGAYYGASGIPQRWLDGVFWGDEITTLADELLSLSTRSQPR